MSSEKKAVTDGQEAFADDDDDMTVRELPTLSAAEHGPDNFNDEARTVIADLDGPAPERPPLPLEASGLHEIADDQIVGDGATTVQDLAKLEQQLLARHSLFSGKTAQITVDPKTEAPPPDEEPSIDRLPFGQPEDAVGMADAVAATVIDDDADDDGDDDRVLDDDAILDAPTALTPLPVSGVHHLASLDPEFDPDQEITGHPVLNETIESPEDVTDMLDSVVAGALASNEETPPPMGPPQTLPPAAEPEATVPVTPTHLNAKAIEDDVDGIQIKRWQVTPSHIAPAPAPAEPPPSPVPAATRLTTILFDEDDGEQQEADSVPRAAQWSEPNTVGDADAALASSYLAAALEDIDALLPLGQELPPEARRLFQGGLMGLAQKLRRARALLPGVDEDAE